MTYNICMKKSTISKLVDFVLVCVFKRLSLFVASWLVLCYLMSRSVVRIPLKCIWIEFHEIWFALQFTNAYVDIILCDFNTVGQTSPHWWQPPRHCIYFDFKQYMRDCVDLHFGVLCLKCVGCQTQIWPLPTPGLAAPNSGWLGFGSCQTRVWQLPNSGLAAAKLGFSNCQTRVWQLPNSGLAAAKLWFTRVWQLPNSGKCQTRVLVMKSFLRWCYCVHILATFHFVLCWFCLVLFCSILSKRFQLCCSVPI